MLYRGILLLLFYFLRIAGFSQTHQVRLKPNVIIIYADDLGYRDLGCYGNPYIRTPNIDQLASMGVRFTQAYAAAPVCSPSRASLLSGLSPATVKVTQYEEGVHGDSSSHWLPADFSKHLPYGTATIATHFRDQGYTTGIIGKWHLGKADRDQPNQFGFDHERVAKNGIFYYDFTLLDHNAEVYRSTEHENLTDRLSAEANTFIKANRDKPFFLYLAHFAPHLLLQPKPQKLPYYYFTWKDKSKGKYDPQYAATVETLDDGVGCVIDILDSLQLLENTIIIFTSDNGGLTAREFGMRPTDNEPLREGKGYLYEGGLRVPMLMMWKGKLKDGATIDAPIIQTDLSPIVQQMIKLSTKKMDPDNFTSAFKDKISIPKTFYWHYPHFSNQGGRPCSAIREGDLKLIHFYENDRLELYDLKNDIGEKNDLSKRFPEKVTELYQRLSLWRRETQASLPTRKPARSAK